jgi:hypothetical protein
MVPGPFIESALSIKMFPNAIFDNSASALMLFSNQVVPEHRYFRWPGRGHGPRRPDVS